MNKKFSTLVASLLLAGSFSVNAQDNPATELKNGNVYYLQADGSGLTAVDASGATNALKTDVNKSDLDTYAQWKLTKEITVNGQKSYVLKNVETGDVLSFSGAGALELNGANNYGSVSDVLTAELSYGQSKVYLKEIDPIASTTVALNNNQGWRKGFAIEAESADHKKVVAVEPNVFMNGIIKAYNAEALNEVGCVNVNPSESGEPRDQLQKRLNLTGHMLLKVAGEWDGADLYEKKYVEGAQKWVLNEGVLAKFRASKFIVMDKEVYSNFATNVDGGATKGYKFAVVTGAELINKEGDCDYDPTENTSVTHHVMNAVFDIKQDPTVPVCANDLIISLPQAYTWTDTDNDGKKEYNLAATSQTPYVAIFNFEGKNYLGSTNNVDEAIKSHLALNDDVLVAQKDWAGKIVNIVSTANTSWTAESEEVSSKYVDGTVPEGQWIVQGSENEKPGAFSFMNRESEEDFELEDKDGYLYSNFTIYKTATANQYEVVYNNGEEKADLVITNAPARANIFANYMNLDESLLKDQKFNISVVTDLFQNVYLAETGNAKTVELTNDVENAGAWSLVKYNSDKNYEAGIEVADTIYHFNKDINYWNPKKAGGAGWDTYTDTLAMFAYTIQNEAGKYLDYNEVKRAYEVVEEAALKGTDNKFDARKHAPKFIVKEKSGQNNILAVEEDNFYNGDDKNVWLEQAEYKLFGAFSYNKVDDVDDIYNVIDNDLFSIKEVSAPEYRRIAGMDAIKIFKADNNSDILFEHNGFLAMEHLSDFADMKAAMFADTAYVRNETRKPQYLLAVNTNQVIDKEECDIPGHPHAQADTMYGRFLVNLVDSAKAFAAVESKLENPYMWEGGYKLAFRAGKHTGDKLIMDVATPAAKDTIDLSNNNNKIGAYAFRYVDRESESFIIETSLDGSNTPGYIKWLNGTPVVIAEVEKAEVFNLAETEEAPTANESVEVSEVSVVAANGAVIVKGAEGKKVAISNILGQTIANAVVSSDNATIAVPAGIVVVAVEGEDAVKVVVK